MAVVTFSAALDQIIAKINSKIDLFRIVNNSWIDTVLTGLVLFLLSELFFFQRSLPKCDQIEKKSEREIFSAAIIQFARHLKDTRRYGPLLMLRDNLSHILHLLCAHTDRVELGRLALAAAVAEDKSEIHRALILMDDLGWAFAELNDPSQAKLNIAKGIAITRSSHAADPMERARMCIARAKGLRHLAMLSSTKAEAMDYLKQATGELTTLKADAAIMLRIGDDVARDEAQIKHAEATIFVKELRLDVGIARPISDLAVLQAANDAILAAEEAAKIFEDIRDDERHAKALTLVEQIQKRLGMEVEAIETNARIRRVIRIAKD